MLFIFELALIVIRRLTVNVVGRFFWRSGNGLAEGLQLQVAVKVEFIGIQFQISVLDAGVAGVGVTVGASTSGGGYGSGSVDMGSVEPLWVE